MIQHYTHKFDVIGVDKVQIKLRFADSFNDFLPTGFIIVSGQQHRPHRRKRSKNHGNNNRLLSSKPKKKKGSRHIYPMSGKVSFKTIITGSFMQREIILKRSSTNRRRSKHHG